MIQRNEATQRQVDAANPRASTWLSANAGSGKTRVLTDRVARLLLDGTSPQNILCLTYTKAAASEMQNRLFKRLGAWAMASEAELREKLTELGAEGTIGDDELSRARTLFARAVETPGGLKIQTIHSFCSALLRRFPLEAGVPPGFTEMDERSAAQLMSEIVEEMAEGRHRDVIEGLAAHYSGEDFALLAAEVASRRDAFAPPLDKAGTEALFGLPKGCTASDIISRVCLGGEAALMKALLPALQGGGATDAKAHDALAALDLDAPTLDCLSVMEGVFLTGKAAKEPFTAKIGKFPTKAVQKTLVAHMDQVEQLMARVEDTREMRLCFLAAQKCAALHRFAGVFLPLYAERKLLRGWLDFDDLILKARDLLTDPSVAAWVLWRLDGGIDHILVDEAQDTSPAQWDVIELLAQEIVAGEGVREAGERTIFVVGDKKQSIYSFQGADPDAFDTMRDHFADRLPRETGLNRLELQHSFRSSEAILSLVDRVFEGPLGEGLGREVRHRAFHESMPGRVDLWPLSEPEPAAEDPEWYEPVDVVSPGDASVQLASEVAKSIRAMLDAGETIPAGQGKRRRMTEGDVLILVRGRGLLFEEIIRACKREHLAIAGADRLKLGAELAVKDLTALLSFLTTPEDDLSLAAALRSPLFGWTEAQLFDLAHKRTTSFLWNALRDRRDDFPETLAILDDLRGETDFLRPYDLLERVLVRHGGRSKLLARLGPEAEDGVDELLNQALTYERTDVPSLTGFLTWLEAEDVEVKRQSDSAGGKIRVMTVHGAKGLEAPVVILPDTMRQKRGARAEILRDDEGRALWKTRAEDRPEPVAKALARIEGNEERELARLLYVAMTRAETWLIVCGAGDPAKMRDTWYASIAGAMGEDAKPLETPFGHGRRLAHGDWHGGELVEAPATTTSLAALPEWIDRMAEVPAKAPDPLSPSDLGGAKAMPGEGQEKDAALAKGRDLHLLLEVLPTFPEESWPDVAGALLPHDAGPEAVAALLDEARHVLTSPDLAPLYGPDTLYEVEVSAELDELDGRRIAGTIDLLLVRPDRVLAVDYKSNVMVPKRAEDTPEGLLRQMGAYAAALRRIYPDRAVETAILWTATATLMPLAQSSVAAALRRAGLP